MGLPAARVARPGRDFRRRDNGWVGRTANRKWGEVGLPALGAGLLITWKGGVPGTSGKAGSAGRQAAGFWGHVRAEGLSCASGYVPGAT